MLPPMRWLLFPATCEQTDKAKAACKERWGGGWGVADTPMVAIVSGPVKVTLCVSRPLR